MGLTIASSYGYFPEEPNNNYSNKKQYNLPLAFILYTHSVYYCPRQMPNFQNIYPEGGGGLIAFIFVFVSFFFGRGVAVTPPKDVSPAAKKTDRAQQAGHDSNLLVQERITLLSSLLRIPMLLIIQQRYYNKRYSNQHCTHMPHQRTREYRSTAFAKIQFRSHGGTIRKNVQNTPQSPKPEQIRGYALTTARHI